MHVVGLLDFKLPIGLGCRAGPTFWPWVAAVAVPGLALAIAARERLGRPLPAGGALAMGGGICVMHCLGMAAIDLAPGIAWNRPLVALSALIAVAASAAALLILFGMRRLRGLQARLAQGGAAPVMGAAICGMHDTGMAAAGFPVGALTGVPHQARFDDQLQQALAQAARHAGRRLAVLFIDLDGCKPVNAPWGHALGDPLPRQAALRMRARCRSTDALAPATYAAKRAGATGSSASTQAAARPPPGATRAAACRWR